MAQEGEPTGVAVFHCITRFQTQAYPPLRVRSATPAICGIIVALDWTALSLDSERLSRVL